MKKNISGLVVLISMLITSCTKTISPVPEPEPLPAPQMVYIDLNNTEIKYQSPGLFLDLDKDNRADLLFEVIHVGDNLLAVDKFQFNVVTSSRTFLPVNSIEQSPAVDESVIIPTDNFDSYTWWNAVEIILLEKLFYGSGSVVWRGNWLGKIKKYLPVQLLTANGKYNAWIEITEDRTNERLILHRAAISKYPGTSVKAGL